MKDILTRKREGLGLTREQMAKKCQCTQGLLRMLEEGETEITHPHIASRIAKGYGLSLEEYNRIVHKNHRADRLPKPTAPPTEENLDRLFHKKPKRQADEADGGEGDGEK